MSCKPQKYKKDVKPGKETRMWRKVKKSADKEYDDEGTAIAVASGAVKKYQDKKKRKKESLMQREIEEAVDRLVEGDI